MWFDQVRQAAAPRDQLQRRRVLVLWQEVGLSVFRAPFRDRLRLAHRPRGTQRSREVNLAQGKNFPWLAKMPNGGCVVQYVKVFGGLVFSVWPFLFLFCFAIFRVFGRFFIYFLLLL